VSWAAAISLSAFQKSSSRLTLVGWPLILSDLFPFYAMPGPSVARIMRLGRLLGLCHWCRGAQFAFARNALIQFVVLTSDSVANFTACLTKHRKHHLSRARFRAPRPTAERLTDLEAAIRNGYGADHWINASGRLILFHPSISLVAAGASGFLTLIQSRKRPVRYERSAVDGGNNHVRPRRRPQTQVRQGREEKPALPRAA
jgi:hypothetical protein